MINNVQMFDASLRRKIERKSLHFCEKHIPRKFDTMPV